MAKIRVKATQEDVVKANQDQGEFKLPPVGLYVLTCTEANPGNSKGDDGEPDESKPRVEFIYSFTGAGREENPIKENYGKLWDYMSFSDAAGWKRVEIMKAYGFLPEDHVGELDTSFDTDDCINRKVLARIKHETQGQGKNATKRAKIAKLYKYGSTTSASTDTEDGTAFASTEETAFATDEGTDDTFGSDTDAVDSERSQKLEAMTLKELGEIAKGVDVDPKALIVKGSDGKLDSAATQRAVIEAILAAEEDPF
jgi:hypothetical protein